MYKKDFEMYSFICLFYIRRALKYTALHKKGLEMYN